MSLELKPSQELMSLVNNWADGYLKSIELPIKILEIGERDGLSKQEIRRIVEDALVARGLSERRIREVLPPELKDTSKITHKAMRHSSAALEEDYPTVEPDSQPIGQTLNQAVDIVQEYESLKKENHQLKNALQKKSLITTAEDEIKNFDTIFEMLPGDDIDTYKNKSGTQMLLERVLVNLKHQDPHKRLKYQWWVRVIK